MNLDELVGPSLLPDPERCPGAYVMFFYCKYRNKGHRWAIRGVYKEEADQVGTRGEAIAQMRRSGWIYHRDGTATCPLCAAALSAHHLISEGEGR